MHGIQMSERYINWYVPELGFREKRKRVCKKSLDPLAQSLGSSVNSALATKSIFQKTGRVDRGLGGVPTWYGSPTQ